MQVVILPCLAADPPGGGSTELPSQPVPVVIVGDHGLAVNWSDGHLHPQSAGASCHTWGIEINSRSCMDEVRWIYRTIRTAGRATAPRLRV